MNKISESSVAEDQFISWLAAGVHYPINYGIGQVARLDAIDRPIINRIDSFALGVLKSTFLTGLATLAYSAISGWKPKPGDSHYVIFGTFVFLSVGLYFTQMEKCESNRLKSDLFVKQALKDRFESIAYRMEDLAAYNSDELKEYSQDILDNRQFINKNIEDMLPKAHPNVIKNITRPVFEAAEKITRS